MSVLNLDMGLPFGTIGAMLDIVELGGKIAREFTGAAATYVALIGLS